MKRLAVFSGLLFWVSCAHRLPVPDYDVALEAVPIAVKAVDGKSVVDAIEDSGVPSDPPRAVVMLKINRVLTGEFTRLKVGGASQFEQMKEAAGDGKILKILTLDFTDPDEEYEKSWLSIAVADPVASFGAREGESVPPAKFKIYLKREADDPKSYRMVALRRGD